MQSNIQHSTEQYFTCPSADHARDVHCGGSALLFVLITSCLSSSTIILPSRSYRGTTKAISNYKGGVRGAGENSRGNKNLFNYGVLHFNPMELRNSLFIIKEYSWH